LLFLRLSYTTLAELKKQLALVSQLAQDNELPDAVVNETGLKLTPHSTTVPDGL